MHANRSRFLGQKNDKFLDFFEVCSNALLESLSNQGIVLRRSDDFKLILASLEVSLMKNKIFKFLTLCSATNDKNDALRVSPAVTRLTVFRRLQVLWRGSGFLIKTSDTRRLVNSLRPQEHAPSIAWGRFLVTYFLRPQE